MVLKDRVLVFASHKGGTGKTQLCFQAAAQYADGNPDVNVLLMDMTELGDLTKRCLGGAGDGGDGGEENYRKLTGGIFDLIEKADPDSETNTSVVKRLRDVFLGAINGAGGGSSNLIDESAIQCTKYNECAPDNLYLISSGAATAADEERAVEDTLKLATAVRKEMETSSKTWKVFIDTDGDRRPAPATKLAYAIGEACVIPIQPDQSDFQRLEPMFRMLAVMQANGELPLLTVQMVIWNKIQLYRKDAIEEGTCIGTFTPPKVTVDMIKALNQRLFSIATASGAKEVFFHKNSDNAAFFAKASTCLVRDFPDTCAYPANAMGLPYCRMKPGKVVTAGGTEFSVQKPQIESCVEGVAELLARLESMEL